MESENIDLQRYSAQTRIFHLTVVLILLAFSFGPSGSEQHLYSA